MDLDNDHMDNALQKSNNEFEFVEVKMEAAEELDVDQDQCDVDSSLPRIKNEFEYVEIKMENPEELDVEQKASRPNAGSKLCNEVGSFIRDPLLIKEEKEEYPQDDPDPMPRELYILGHSVAERSENAVLERLEQDELEPKQPPSSPVYSCPKYEAKPMSDDSHTLEHIADNDDDQRRDTVVGGSSTASSPFFSCTQCDLKCTRLTVLNKHISTHHVAAESSGSGVDQNRRTEQSSPKSHSTSSIEGKLFSCELCDFKTRYGSHLKRHLFRHTGGKLYSCEFCEYKSTQSDEAKPLSDDLHPLKHIADNEDDQRGDTVVGVQTLNQFEVGKTASSPFYSCTQCDYKCTRLTVLNKHIRTHQVVAAESSGSGVDQNRGTEQSSPKSHSTSNIEVKLFSCELCDFKTRYGHHLKRHLLRHTGEKLYSCEFCEYKSTQSGNLKVHVRKHTGEKPYNCESCGFKTATSSDLKVHMGKHTGEKRYSCEFCEYKSSQSCHFKEHLRTHTGEKPFACVLCEFKATSSSNLKVHMRKHTGEKPYNCELCEYKAITLGNLKLHMIKHTGEKPFACELCEYKTTRSNILKKHLRKHSGEDP